MARGYLSKNLVPLPVSIRSCRLPVQTISNGIRNLHASACLRAIGIVIVLWCLQPTAYGQDVVPEYTPPASIDSAFRIVNANVYQIGNITLNKQTREISIPGWVNMNEGMVEYMAVAPYGKTYESILILDVRPLHVQLALLLLGLDYEGNLEFQGDTAVPKGDSVFITVKWVSPKGDTVSSPASALAADLQSKRKMLETPWVFTGSSVYEGQFVADMEGSIIATYSDPVAILNNPLAGRTNDEVYVANREVIPAPGTKILMVIKAQ